MRAGVLAAASVLAVAACVTATLPQSQFARHGAALHLALETAASLIALLTGFLVFGRLVRLGRLNDLLLASALTVLALLNLYLLLMPGLAQPAPDGLLLWVLLAGRSLSAGLFALAAFASPRRLRRPGLSLAIVVGGAAAVVMLAAMGLSTLAGDSGHRPAELATAALYGTAAIGFSSRSWQSGDRFLGWLALAGILAASCYLNYALYSYPYSPMVHTGDIFRLCFYTTLLIGSMIEIWSYWHALSRAAVLEERRRIACDLHDGLAQELAYLARNLGTDWEPGEEKLRALRMAVERARLESRRVLSTLATTDSEPAEVALARAATEVAERFQLRLHLNLVPGVSVSAARRQALVRIACEAIANTGRHSGASEVSLKLERDGPRVRLRVSDSGRGFDSVLTGDGFGLVAMRQRASAVGGELRISSTVGRGSEVEAAL